MKDHYPTDIFPMLTEADLERYRKMFEEAGLSQDRYSSYCMRKAYRNGYEDALKECSCDEEVKQ